MKISALQLIVAGVSAAALHAAPGTAPVTWSDVLKQPDAWYASTEARGIAAHVLEHQRADGGWPKNTDMAAAPDPAAVTAARSKPDSTIDNGATVTQLRFLARVLHAGGDAAYRSAFNRGLDYLLAAQYPNGGWPQYYPLRADYSRHITFNDDAMAGVVMLLWDVRDGVTDVSFVDPNRKGRAGAAVERAIALVLRSQIRVNGRLTAWCAQHDEVTLEPRKARTYEHISLSGAETVGLLRILMRVETPSPPVVEAVDAAVAWLQAVQLAGVRVEQRPDPSLPGGTDRVVVADRSAAPLWARFYEIGTNRPIYSGRDGIVRYALSEIEPERRNGYSWLGTWPQRLLADEYPGWKKRITTRAERMHQGDGWTATFDVERGTLPKDGIQ